VAGHGVVIGQRDDVEARLRAPTDHGSGRLGSVRDAAVAVQVGAHHVLRLAGQQRRPGSERQVQVLARIAQVSEL
jgi:hypothetical protein